MPTESGMEGFSYPDGSEEPKPRYGRCCHRADHLRATDVGLSLFGVVGWLALPKCPLCVTAHLAIVSGLSISAGLGRAVYVALTAIAAGCFLAGALRLGNTCRKLLLAKSN